MNLIQAIIYGIVQGITEWLPVSSTAHLRVVPALLGWTDPGAGFTAVIQLGTSLAVLIFFRQDLVRILGAWFRSFRGEGRDTADVKLAWGVVWGTIPIVIIALVAQRAIEGNLRSLYVIAVMLIGFGLVMAWADRRLVGERGMKDVTVRDGLIVGLFQCLSLIPGTSRSGSTIVGAYTQGFDRVTAARFSFLLSIPSILAAGLYQLIKQRHALLEQALVPTLVATGVSFVVGYATIAWFIGYLQRRGLGIFVGYRILLGVVLIGLLQANLLKPNDEPTVPPSADTVQVQGR